MPVLPFLPYRRAARYGGSKDATAVGPTERGALAQRLWEEVGGGESSTRVFVSKDGARHAKVASGDEVAAARW